MVQSQMKNQKLCTRLVIADKSLVYPASVRGGGRRGVGAGAIAHHPAGFASPPALHARPCTLTTPPAACPTQQLLRALAPDVLLVTFALGTPVDEVVAAAGSSVFTTAAIWTRHAKKLEVEPMGASLQPLPGLQGGRHCLG